MNSLTDFPTFWRTFLKINDTKASKITTPIAINMFFQLIVVVTLAWVKLPLSKNIAKAIMKYISYRTSSCVYGHYRSCLQIGVLFYS
jgi:hypothetical protein